MLVTSSSFLTAAATTTTPGDVGDDDALLLADYGKMVDNLLPVEDAVSLLQFHTSAQLRAFYAQHSECFNGGTNVMMIRLPPSVAALDGASTVDIASGLLAEKQVYRLGSQQYVFIDGADCALISDMSYEKQHHFQQLYQDCVFQIVASRVESSLLPTKETTTPSTTLVSLKTTISTEGGGELARLTDDPNQSDALMNMLVRWRDEHDEIVARNHELELANVSLRHEKEMSEAMHKMAIQEMELVCLRLLQQQQQHPSGHALTISHVSPTTTGQQLALPTTTTSGNAKTTGITRVSQWLGKNLYGQEKHVRDDRLVQHAHQKWACMFDNPAINVQSLHGLLQVQQHHRYRYRLFVPLTYKYNLKAVLRIIRQAMRPRNVSHWDTLVEACPNDYRVVLYGLNPYDTAQASQTNQQNCIVLATHLHFIMQARAMDGNEAVHGGKWRTCLDSLSQNRDRFTPDLTILESRYPSSLHFGDDTIMSFDMTPRVRYTPGTASGGPAPRSPKKAKKPTTKRGQVTVASAKQRPTLLDDERSDGDDEEHGSKKKTRNNGMGTGNGKGCPFCGSLGYLSKKTGGGQVSHQPKKCPVLATLSNNEVDILNQLLIACRRKEKSQTNTLPRLKFYFGVEQSSHADKDLLSLGPSTLFRHATPEELANGQHVNGLRLNRKIYIGMRRVVYERMRDHMDNDALFGAMEKHVVYAMDDLDGLQDLQEANDGQMPPIRQLIYDADGLYFIASKFDDTKKPRRPFGCGDGVAGEIDDGLYFSFDEQQQVVDNPRAQAQCELYQREMQNQQHFVATYVEKMSYPLMDMSAVPMDASMFHQSHHSQDATDNSDPAVTFPGMMSMSMMMNMNMQFSMDSVMSNEYYPAHHNNHDHMS